ncbi:MAG: DUF3866 family protein [Bacillota bacterium]
MIATCQGRVEKILKKEGHKTEILVEVEGKSGKAVNYDRLTGNVDIGDMVVLNTTAVDLNLGSGGYHFVISNLNQVEHQLTQGGHIMKLRYTPFQLKVFAAEEQESQHHDVFNNFESLQGMPVIIGTLHSMLAPVVEILKHHKPDIKIAYIMTDGAALPIDFSNVVNQLKDMGKIHGTITIGNAFGGDLDCVTIYNGLIAAKDILHCDIAVVTMGPGIAGTGTTYGFTGIEQGHIIDAVNDLGGTAIAVPRVSFKDPRERHQGISHHSITVLGKICKTKAWIGIPDFDEEKNNYIHGQVLKGHLNSKHEILRISGEGILEVLDSSTIRMTTMGRGLTMEKEFFITCGAAAVVGIKILNDHQ